jgi:nucleoside-diphosphate-sugar epimerase
MKILVTGGAGYIGCVLVPMLLEQGYGVRVLDNLMYEGLGLIGNFSKPSFDFIKGDIRDAHMVQDATRDCDIVIHLAAIVGFPACRKNPQLAEDVNFYGTKVVAEAAGRDRLVLFGSTGSNYGAVTDQICTEETPLNPQSLYGKTKVDAERYLLEHCNTIAFRFATAFGTSPRMRVDLLINDFVYTAFRLRYLVIYEGQFMRSFIHVRDMARSFLFAIENSSRMRGQIYNIGSESMNYSKADVCKMIQKKIDYYLHFADIGTDADQRNYVISYEKVRNLGYSTTITVEEGIDELVRALPVLDIKNPYSNL